MNIRLLIPKNYLIPITYGVPLKNKLIRLPKSTTKIQFKNWKQTKIWSKKNNQDRELIFAKTGSALSEENCI